MPTLPTIPASVIVSTRRPSAWSIRQTIQQPASIVVPVPGLDADRLAVRGRVAQAGDGRALAAAGGQQLGAGVQRGDQLDIVAAAVRRCPRSPRPARGAQACDTSIAEPPSRRISSARSSAVVLEQAPVDVRHERDPLRLGAPEAVAAVARRRVRSSGGRGSPSPSQHILAAGDGQPDRRRHGRDVHRRGAGRPWPRDHGQGVDDAGRPRRAACIEGIGAALEAAGIARAAVGQLGPRHDGGHQRAARAARRPHRAGGHARASPTCSSWPPGPAAPVPARAGDRPRRLPERDAPRSTSGWRPDGVLAAARRGLASPRRPPAAPRAASRRWRSACCTAYADPAPRAGGGARAARRAAGAFVVASHEIAAEYREYERARRRSVDAYLGPLAGRYLRRLAAAAPARAARARC